MLAFDLLKKESYLLNDFFKHLHNKYKLKSFLCGKSTTDLKDDLRVQLMHILKKRMGCKSFRGEDIPNLNDKISEGRNLIDVEIKEARDSDLVILFMNSVGVASELAVFVRDKIINNKLIVFNDNKYENAKSFLNRGPLKLVHKHHLAYYHEDVGLKDMSILNTIDTIIAKKWFDKMYIERRIKDDIGFGGFVIMALICVFYPLDRIKLENNCSLKNIDFSDVLKILFKTNLINKKNEFYFPKWKNIKQCVTAGCISDISNVRLRLIPRGLIDCSDLVNLREVF